MVVGVMAAFGGGYVGASTSWNRVCPGIHNDSPSTLNISLLPATPKSLMTCHCIRIAIVSVLAIQHQLLLCA